MKTAKSVAKKRQTVKGGPRRPLTAYNLFFQIGRQRLVNGESVDDISVKDIDNITIHHEARHKLRTTHQRTHGKIGFQELAKTLGRKWKSLDSLCKRRLEELATLEKKRYAAEMAVWKKNQDTSLASSSTKNPSHDVRVSPPELNLRAKKVPVETFKQVSTPKRKESLFSLMQQAQDIPASLHSQKNTLSTTQGFKRHAPPQMETPTAFQPPIPQNDHFQQYNSPFTSSYQNQPFHASNMWNGTVNDMQTTQPFCIGSCEQLQTMSPRKVSLCSCQSMEQAVSYNAHVPVQMKQWNHPQHNMYQDYPYVRHIEPQAPVSCEETNTVHSLTNIDLDFLSVHCEDSDDISILGM